MVLRNSGGDTTVCAGEATCASIAVASEEEAERYMQLADDALDAKLIAQNGTSDGNATDRRRRRLAPPSNCDQCNNPSITQTVLDNPAYEFDYEQWQREAKAEAEATARTGEASQRESLTNAVNARSESEAASNLVRASSTYEDASAAASKKREKNWHLSPDWAASKAREKNWKKTPPSFRKDVGFKQALSPITRGPRLALRDADWDARKDNQKKVARRRTLAAAASAQYGILGKGSIDNIKSGDPLQVARGINEIVGAVGTMLSEFKGKLGKAGEMLMAITVAVTLVLDLISIFAPPPTPEPGLPLLGKMTQHAFRGILREELKASFQKRDERKLVDEVFSYKGFAQGHVSAFNSFREQTEWFMSDVQFGTPDPRRSDGKSPAAYFSELLALARSDMCGSASGFTFYLRELETAIRKSAETMLTKETFKPINPDPATDCVPAGSCCTDYSGDWYRYHATDGNYQRREDAAYAGEVGCDGNIRVRPIDADGEGNRKQQVLDAYTDLGTVYEDFKTMHELIEVYNGAVLTLMAVYNAANRVFESRPDFAWDATDELGMYSFESLCEIERWLPTVGYFTTLAKRTGSCSHLQAFDGNLVPAGGDGELLLCNKNLGSKTCGENNDNRERCESYHHKSGGERYNCEWYTDPSGSTYCRQQSNPCTLSPCVSWSSALTPWLNGSVASPPAGSIWAGLNVPTKCESGVSGWQKSISPAEPCNEKHGDKTCNENDGKGRDECEKWFHGPYGGYYNCEWYPSTRLCRQKSEPCIRSPAGVAVVPTCDTGFAHKQGFYAWKALDVNDWKNAVSPRCCGANIFCASSDCKGALEDLASGIRPPPPPSPPAASPQPPSPPYAPLPPFTPPELSFDRVTIPANTPSDLAIQGSSAHLLVGDTLVFLEAGTYSCAGAAARVGSNGHTVQRAAVCGGVSGNWVRGITLPDVREYKVCGTQNIQAFGLFDSDFQHIEGLRLRAFRNTAEPPIGLTPPPPCAPAPPSMPPPPPPPPPTPPPASPSTPCREGWTKVGWLCYSQRTSGQQTGCSATDCDEVAQGCLNQNQSRLPSKEELEAYELAVAYRPRGTQYGVTAEVIVRVPGSGCEPGMELDGATAQRVQWLTHNAPPKGAGTHCHPWACCDDPSRYHVCVYDVRCREGWTKVGSLCYSQRTSGQTACSATDCDEVAQGCLNQGARLPSKEELEAYELAVAYRPRGTQYGVTAEVIVRVPGSGCEPGMELDGATAQRVQWLTHNAPPKGAGTHCHPWACCDDPNRYHVCVYDI